MKTLYTGVPVASLAVPYHISAKDLQIGEVHVPATGLQDAATTSLPHIDSSTIDLAYAVLGLQRNVFNQPLSNKIVLPSKEISCFSNSTLPLLEEKDRIPTKNQVEENLNKPILLNGLKTGTKQGTKRKGMDPPSSSSDPSSEPPKKVRPKKGRRPQDMPRHPLTAYNFFFSDERERILKTIGEGNDPFDDVNNLKEEEAPCNLSTEEKQKIIIKRLENRRCQKVKRRPHRKTHGMISFKELASFVGKRWRELPTKTLTYYHELAEMDMANYRQAMVEYKKKKESGDIESLTR